MTEEDFFWKLLTSKDITAIKDYFKDGRALEKRICNGHTPLTLALSLGREMNEVALALIDLGADVNAESNHMCPLSFAAWDTGCLNVILRLVEKGATADVDGAICEALKGRHLAYLDVLPPLRGGLDKPLVDRRGREYKSGDFAEKDATIAAYLRSYEQKRS